MRTVMKRITSLILYLLLIFAGKLLSQPLSVSTETLTSKDGLSENSIVKIFQDSRQFLWFGTFDGVNRYDGFNFKVYKTILEDTTTISGQHFGTICEDRDGNLWFGSEGGGLNKYDRNTETFKRYMHDQNKKNSIISNYVHDLHIDKNGIIWIATESGLDEFDPHKEKFNHYRNDPHDVNSMLSDYAVAVNEDSKGNIWIAGGYGLDRFDQVNKKFVHYFQKHFISGGIYVDRSKTLWVGTSLGLARFDEKRNKFDLYTKINNNSADKSVKQMFEDSRGNFWVVLVSGGLYNFDRKTCQFTAYRDNPYNRTNLGKDIIRTIFEDKFGVLWISTAGGGVTKLDLRKAQFANYSTLSNNIHSLNNNNVYSIVEDEAGILWIGTYGGGFNRLDLKNNGNGFERFVHIGNDPNSLQNNLVRCLFKDKNGLLWIGTESGLEFFDYKTNKFIRSGNIPIISLPSDPIVTVFSLNQTSSGEIWIGTYNHGLYIYNPIDNSLINFQNDPLNPKSLSNNTVRKVLEDRSKNIWICTDNGLNRFDRSKKEFVCFKNDPGNPSSISSNNAVSISEDRSGGLWVGTTVGLNKMEGNRLNNSEVKFVRFSKKNGLPDNNIQGILEDKIGNLWISTNKGLSKYDPRKKIFANYNEDNGLLSDEFYVNSFCERKTTGEMIFGGNKGFTVFRPEKIKNDENIPPVILTDFSLFNKPVAIGKETDGVVILNKSISETDHITLSYQHSVITFEYAALHFTSPTNNKYAYYMEGLESNWNYVGNRRSATYVNLPPGEYVFKVKASNNSGFWNDKGISVRVTVIPPFWMTWTFRITAGLLIALIVFAGYKLRIRSIEMRREQLEQLNNQLQIENQERQKSETKVKEYAEELKLLNQTKDKFFSIIAHDLQNPFITLVGFSDLILTDYAEMNDSDRIYYIEEMQKSANLSHQLLQNLLQWSRSQTGRLEFTPRQLEIWAMVQENIAFVKASADKKEIRIKNNSSQAQFVFADESMVNTIIRNLITNAIKFTNLGGEININTLPVDGFIEISVSDNGVGMDETTRQNLFKLDVTHSTVGTASEAGTGLGLILCKEFVERHGGRIWVESEKGVGTSFIFSLPSSPLPN